MTWHPPSKPVGPYRAGMREGFAQWRGWDYTDVVDVRDDWCIDDAWHWFLTATFEGEQHAVAFATRTPSTDVDGPWPGIARAAWRSSLDHGGYVEAVERTREAIARGDVYQANICRILQAEWPDGASLRGLARALRDHHPAPYAGLLDVPAGPGLPDGLGVVSASPELFLARDGTLLRTAPIKGTAPTAAAMLAKDEAENLMIVDLMRNDLARICMPGSVRVSRLFDIEEHPGLVHLVSEVEGRLASDADAWPSISTLLPAGSVSGAPKSSALRIIRALEGRDRGLYCGVLGVASGGVATLAVGIRCFVRRGPWLEFGLGAGITWGSDPEGEWRETELKADRLLAVAAIADVPS